MPSWALNVGHGKLVKDLIFPKNAIEPKKLEHGNPLTILGVDVTVKSKEILIWPTAEKLSQWKLELAKVEQSGIMHSGQASKMAGRLEKDERPQVPRCRRDCRRDVQAFVR